MKIIKSPRELSAALRRFRCRRVGFVPTMGALHEGHLALVRRARRENTGVVASVFVNPAQFGPKEDFSKYPRDLAADAAFLRKEKADILFAPDVKDMYPPGFQTLVQPGPVAAPLCGARRPGHFAGVCTVVLKLLEMVRPDTLYLGRKDYQQAQVLKTMVRDLNVPVSVAVVPTVREADGLAMSSRNRYLSPDERAAAPGLRRALLAAKRLAAKGERDARKLRRAALAELSKERLFRLDYLEIVDAGTLETVVRLKPRKAAVAAAAVFLGKTRLIDNETLTVHR